MSPLTDIMVLNNKLHERVNLMRGKFLNISSLIEIILEQVIAQYFCKDVKKRDLFSSELVVRQNFNKKIEVLEQIIINDIPHWLEDKENQGFFKNLKATKDHRNILAHGTINYPEVLTEEFLKKAVEGIYSIRSFTGGGKLKITEINPTIQEDKQIDANQCYSDLNSICLLLSIQLSEPKFK